MGGNISSSQVADDRRVADRILAARVRDLIARRESATSIDHLEHIPFHRILLSFPPLRRTFSRLRAIYNDSVVKSEGATSSWAREASSIQKTVSSSSTSSK